MLDSTLQVAMVAVKLCHPNCDFIVDGNKDWHATINYAALARTPRRNMSEFHIGSQQKMHKKLR